MAPLSFLRAVWPDSGHYAIATLFTPPGAKAPVFVHKVFDTIDAAAAYADKIKAYKDLYFCVHSLAEPKVWNPLKKDYKTGELGAYEVRTQRNMLEARAFFFDLDVGSSTERTPKYASQQEAIADLKRFCKETFLPKPLLVSSGGGVHVYWPLDAAIPSQEWRQHAHKLQHLARFHGLRADPARTSDSASVLRVAGSLNHKNPAQPRPVEVYQTTTPVAAPKFLKLLNDAIVRTGSDVRPLPEFKVNDDPLGSNTELEFDAPPVGMKALLVACAQMRRLATLRGNVSEPEWYHSINLVRFTEGGMANVHKISSAHPEYDAAATEQKVQQLEQKGIKPTSCFKLAEVCGEQHCVGCPFLGKVKSPIVAARQRDEAPPPIVHSLIGATVQSQQIPPPPKGFSRSKEGTVCATIKNSKGDELAITILRHDLYPINRLVNRAMEREQLKWRAMLPGPNGATEHDFVIDADALYDSKKLMAALANQGVYALQDNKELLGKYMTAYIAELQKMIAPEAQHNHLGWINDQTDFILPDKIICGDGTVKASVLSLAAQRSSQQVHKKGTLERQVELLRFYHHPGYVAQQFFILCGLGAPLFHATGHHGVIVNASGDPGASKSTSLYTAASFWGQPEMYPINGTNNGATVNARNERLSTLANLPVCVDEVTHMPAKDAADLAMGVTQPGHRIRLGKDSAERATLGGYKATIMLTTANSSLHSLLSTANVAGTAGSMRVVEIIFKALGLHPKFEADEYIYELKQNYGHIGEAFMAYVVRHRAVVDARVRAEMKRLDTLAHIQSAERFWSAAAASAIVACEIANELGLLMYDANAIRDWFLKKQIPHMRGTVLTSYNTPLGTLADYLQTINGEIMVTTAPLQNNAAGFPIAPPRGKLLGHYDVGSRSMWVLIAGFKEYCTRIGANYLSIMNELSTGEKRVVTNPRTRRVLGAGTEWAKAQAWVFAIDMSHPEVSGAVDVAGTSPPPPAPIGQPNLRIVK